MTSTPLSTLWSALGRRRLALIGLALLLALGALEPRARPARRPTPPVCRPASAADFTLPPPHRLARPKTLWATWYWTPTYASTQGVLLLDEDEKPLGGTARGLHLPPESFCRAAVEGAVRVDGHVYTFAKLGPHRLTDCRPYWPTMTQAPYVRFTPSDTPYGEGVSDYRLVPYRTLAVDESEIPIGTVLYVPAARGCLLTLPDGRHVRHDGYFFAGDDGYGVRGNHLDVFIGISSDCPFPWVVSRPYGTFPAYAVTDPTIVDALRREHLSSEDE